MSNQYRPEKKTLGELLAMTSPPIVVPEWQRSYSWTTREVETFWTDLTRFDELYPGNRIDRHEYFLGSIVIVDASSDHLLLDGQQRLSTAAVLISVVRDNLAIKSQDAATRTQTKWLSDFDDSSNTYTYKITMNKYDREFFRSLVLEEPARRPSGPEPRLGSHHLIKKAHSFFEEKFKEKRARLNSEDEFHRWALRIQRVVTKHMSVVAVFSQDEDNAADVFETLNDRGIGLSTPDLLRNLVLKRAAPEAREEIVRLWGEVLEIETVSPVKKFVRHYWISHHGDVKTQSLYREVKRAVLSANMDSLDLSTRLRDAASVYQDILSGSSPSEEVRALLEDIQELGASIAFPLILSILQETEEDEYREILALLVSVFVRHSLIGELENSRLENVLYRLARQIRQGEPVEKIKSELRSAAPGDKQFVSDFANASIRTRSPARYVLRKLEEDLRPTDEIAVASSKRVHVEHIYPQTPPDADRLSDHGELVHRIGNLTLLSGRLNASIKNAPFGNKVKSYRKSDLKITQALGKYRKWGRKQIEERQQRLAERASEIWSLS